MHFESDQILYSPSDLTLYMDSPFASWMEHLTLTNPGFLSLIDEEDALLSALQHKGLEHESNILNEFIERKLQVVHIDKQATAFERTLTAMQSGADIIYQAAISLLPFQGYVDFLVKVEGQSRFGSYQYEVWDTKLSKTVKPQYLIQLCCYAEMLESIQQRRPERIAVVTGDGEKRYFKVNDYFYYYRNLKRRFLDTHQSFDEQNRPNPGDSSNRGRWSTYAENLLIEADHLSQVATITKSQIKKLNKAGIATMQALADSTLNRIKDMHADVYARLKAQAKIQKESAGKPVPLYQILPHDPDKKTGLSLLPPSSPMDIYFDIEGFPLEEGGLEYLWGVAYYDEQENRQYKDFWAHNQEQEKAAFQAFIDWAYARWEQDPAMHIYHYANYEIAACRKLMGRYGVCEDQVDQLLRNEVFVDLYKIVKGSLLLGEPRYSIKNVEHLYREKRSTEVGSGGDSVVVYKRWQEDPDGDTWQHSAILRAIRDYNIDDCNSTQELVDWLRSRQKECNIAFLGKSEQVDAPENELATNQIQLRDRLLHQASQSKEEDEARVSTLLAWSLEFHRREKKPMYWRLFDRLGQSHEELYEDIDCLAHCHRTEKAPYPLAQSRSKKLIYEYAFDPDQEFKGACEQYFVLDQLRPDGKSLSVNVIKQDSRPGEGLIALQSGEALDDLIALIPDENINAKPIPEAITRQVEAFEQGNLKNTAIHDFLMRKNPRIRDHQADQPIAPSHDASIRLTQIITAVTNLENSYLTIQGPPGSGKTYTAKHVIAELVKQGKKVGISSNSHKAINHLLTSTAKYCQEKAIPAYFACTKETDEEIKNLGIDIYDNKAIAAHLQPACVIGTTAWGFARADLDKAFDYLFIDEAGQVSVANLIAMSGSTNNIVLMGDQMQLGQPSQGSHPEDSGLSILDYLLHTTPTIPDTMGIFLGTTWRMHSAVNRFISDAIYEGKLASAPENDRQCIRVPEGYQGMLNQQAGIILAPVSHEGNTQASDEEVAEIASLAHDLIGRIYTDNKGVERPIDWQDMLFVAPYNHQVNKLRLALCEQAKVGSVDKFQGQEAPIVFLSMCASDANESARGAEFLFNKNRINVAVSRAQCLVIVTYCPALLETQGSTVEQLGMVNLFCRLVRGETD